MFNKAIHKFLITFSVINSDTGETLELENALSGIAIKKDFHKNVFPLYVLTLSITEQHRQYIATNNVIFSINIARYSIDENFDSSEASADSPTTDKEVSNIILLPFDKSKIFINSNDTDIDAEDGKENIENVKTSYNVTCILRTQYYYNTTVFNNCYKDCNLNEIILNEISEIYNSSKFYMQESLNTNKYDSVLIPPMNFVQSVKFIQDNYSLYKDDVNMFFDDTGIYIYDIEEKNRQFNNTMLINIIKSSENADKTLYQNPQIDEDENVQIYLDNNPMILSRHDVYRNETGGTRVFNSYDYNFNLVSRIYNIENNNVTRYFWNSNKEKSFETPTAIYQMVSLSEYNFDPSIITPATKIILDGSDFKDVNGQYSLISEEIYYSTTDFKNYTGKIDLVLGQI